MERLACEQVDYHEASDVCLIDFLDQSSFFLLVFTARILLVEASGKDEVKFFDDLDSLHGMALKSDRFRLLELSSEVRALQRPNLQRHSFLANRKAYSFLIVDERKCLDALFDADNEEVVHAARLVYREEI